MEKKFIRLCPKCEKEIYHTRKSNRDAADKKKRLCIKCKQTNWGKNQSGSNNKFYGKKHSDESKEKMRQYRLGKKLSPECKSIAISNLRRDNRSLYDIWIEKYDEEEVNRRMRAWKENESKSNTRPMLGKPAPKGSGNGWKGWYKGNFFRSLRELSYMIHLDDNGIEWINGEKIRIKYIDYKGANRTYRPDFIVNKTTIVEIKPIRLQTSPSVEIKSNAMKEWCKDNNFKFEIIDIKIDGPKIRLNIDAGNVKFQKNYLERFENYEAKNSDIERH